MEMKCFAKSIFDVYMERKMADFLDGAIMAFQGLGCGAFSVTRWLHYLFNIWPSTTMMICPITFRYQSRFKILSNKKGSVINWRKFLNISLKWRKFWQIRSHWMQCNYRSHVSDLFPTGHCNVCAKTSSWLLSRDFPLWPILWIIFTITMEVFYKGIYLLVRWLPFQQKLGCLTNKLKTYLFTKQPSFPLMGKLSD